MTQITMIAAPPRRRMGARHWLALTIALVTIGVTVALMLDSVWHGAEFTIEHAFGLALLFLVPGAALAGRWALAHKESAAGSAFIVGALLGSALIVYLSAGNQHQARLEVQAAAQNANGARAALEGELKRADGKIVDIKAELARVAGARSLAEIKGALDAIVGDGARKVPATVWRRTSGCSAEHVTRSDSAAACEPVSTLRIENGRALEREALRRRLDAAEAERKGIVAKLETAGGERVVPSKARAFAEVVALFGLNAARVEHMASRLDLVIRTLFLEGLTVVALEYALADLGRPRQGAQEAHQRPIERQPEPTPPTGGRRTRRLVRRDTTSIETRKARARAEVIQFRRPVAQHGLADRWGVGKSMVSAWLLEWELEGVVQRSRDGRQKTVQSVGLRRVA